MNTQPRIVSWFSCGAASAVATKLSSPDVIAYCETGAEDQDNARFLIECETWFGQKVERIRSDKYSNTWDVWTRERYLAGIAGAKCTTELKVKPRLVFQRPTDVHVFGYTADAPDIARAKRLMENYPELTIRTPLIDRQLTKAACLELVQRAGLTLPRVYGMGFHNANCIPCVKATSPAYWALIRARFPDEFARISALSRELGVRLTRVKGERKFIDEIPADQPLTDPVQPSCDFLCAVAEMDL
jgi:hypothetical protein